ncbi:uncharacterized protein LOC113120203 [Carassius auratus]|uniref:Uncharacterized protein LOC113120203 n=1 Tax=Carassius auratus TaxID=7957 RepID=A0A6P6RJP2_CARAU|nr:uncharacterized protein LOC113120203 [Carassius auratus]
MVFFWGGLAEPFKSLMPFWHPDETLEDYINLALQLSGSAVRVELAAEPAQGSPKATVQESAEASSAAPSASHLFLERHRLMRCMRDSQWMSVRAAWSARRTHKVVEPADVPSEAVGLTASLHKAADSTQDCPKAAVSVQDCPEEAVSAHDAPEAASSAHDVPEAAASAHDVPEAAASAHDVPEAAASAHDVPEAAASAHDSHKVVVTAPDPPESSQLETETQN